MFAAVRRSPERMQVIDRVTEWTRERFKLPNAAAISVSEVACCIPGCAPLETVVMFWIEGQCYRFKLFKPVAQLTADDIPYAWLKDALAVPEANDFECC
jgi:hypothetical protein